METYSDIQQVSYQFEANLLVNIPQDEYLIIILDSIDQLETDAYDCLWLPLSFPRNVKVIVSTLPDHGNILSNIKDLMNNHSVDPCNTQHLFVEVVPFDSSTVTIVYNDWLRMKNRSLSDEQWTFIKGMMKERANILPLYMKLIFDILLTWHSYDPIDPQLEKAKTVDDCIRYLFNHLKTIHNSLLFCRALCYMTACRNGISQNELEDVLSLDDEVLKSVFQHYIPPVRRLPGILWTRIRNDLDEYITEKEVDDSPVIYWYT
jgi:NACHT domain- and WD repeat-containing protein